MWDCYWLAVSSTFFEETFTLKKWYIRHKGVCHEICNCYKMFGRMIYFTCSSPGVEFSKLSWLDNPFWDQKDNHSNSPGLLRPVPFSDPSPLALKWSALRAENQKVTPSLGKRKARSYIPGSYKYGASHLKISTFLCTRSRRLSPCLWRAPAVIIHKLEPADIA